MLNSLLVEMEFPIKTKLLERYLLPDSDDWRFCGSTKLFEEENEVFKVSSKSIGGNLITYEQSAILEGNDQPTSSFYLNRPITIIYSPTLKNASAIDPIIFLPSSRFELETPELDLNKKLTSELRKLVNSSEDKIIGSHYQHKITKDAQSSVTLDLLTIKKEQKLENLTNGHIENLLETLWKTLCPGVYVNPTYHSFDFSVNRGVSIACATINFTQNNEYCFRGHDKESIVRNVLSSATTPLSPELGGLISEYPGTYKIIKTLLNMM